MILQHELLVSPGISFPAPISCYSIFGNLLHEYFEIIWKIFTLKVWGSCSSSYKELILEYGLILESNDHKEAAQFKISAWCKFPARKKSVEGQQISPLGYSRFMSYRGFTIVNRVSDLAPVHTLVFLDSVRLLGARWLPASGVHSNYYS